MTHGTQKKTYSMLPFTDLAVKEGENHVRVGVGALPSSSVAWCSKIFAR